MPKKSSLGAAAIHASMPNAQLIAQCGSLDKQKSSEIVEEVLQRSTEIRAGDTTYLEEMLLSQAIALNAFSADCLIKAGGFIKDGMVAKFPELTQTLAQLGLKSQDQSRKAILGVCELRNPKKPSQFIKNYVHQQLNQVELKQQELKQQLEAATNAPLDIGSATEASRTDQEVETVGKQHGTRHPGRKKSVIPEQLKDRMPHS